MSFFTKKTHDVIVYSRQNCCLCDQAKELLEANGLRFREIDIDDDPDLRAKYNDWVPVVVIDGQERFRGRIDARLLKRLLRGAK